MDTIHIEFPNEQIIQKRLCTIHGWHATDHPNNQIHVIINGEEVPTTLMDRPDVQRSFPTAITTGFSTIFDLASRDDLTNQSNLQVDIKSSTGAIQSLSCTISPTLQETIQHSKQITQAKREWCIDHLQCAVCNNQNHLTIEAHKINCTHCNSVYPQDTASLNMITPELYEQFDLKPTSNISANPYDTGCSKIIQDVTASGGMVLDCGAGLRADFNPSVINAEIVDYPTTDILAVGQSLPFKDGSFDAVLSQAVLEHVNDPFVCAEEIVRVTKPGGIIYCVVPLNQPEHGYPNHFYNMTRQGLRNLFKSGVDIEKQFVPDRGKPIFSLRWFLEIYCEGLPLKSKAQFENLTVKDILHANIGDRDPNKEIDFVNQLDTEAQWRLASTTGIILRRTDT